jgi:hypothetical protein
MINALPEWLKGFAALITAIGGFVAVWVGLKVRKTAKTSNHAQGAEKTSEGYEICQSLVAGIEQAKIVSIAKIINGGPSAKVDEPKYMEVLTSSDYQTWLQWKERGEMEPKLVSIHNKTIQHSTWSYKPNEIDNPQAHKWYEDNELKQTSHHLISVNDTEGVSYVLMINYEHEHVLTLKSTGLIRISIERLGDIFAPKQWASKKNYFKN